MFLLSVKIMSCSESESEVDLIGETLNSNYKVESDLGLGNYGTVYKCLDENREDCVVIKVFRNQRYDNMNKISKLGLRSYLVA